MKVIIGARQTGKSTTLLREASNKKKKGYNVKIITDTIADKKNLIDLSRKHSLALIDTDFICVYEAKELKHKYKEDLVVYIDNFGSVLNQLLGLGNNQYVISADDLGSVEHLENERSDKNDNTIHFSMDSYRNCKVSYLDI